MNILLHLYFKVPKAHNKTGMQASAASPPDTLSCLYLLENSLQSRAVQILSSWVNPKSCNQTFQEKKEKRSVWWIMKLHFSHDVWKSPHCNSDIRSHEAAPTSGVWQTPRSPRWGWHPRDVTTTLANEERDRKYPRHLVGKQLKSL